MIRERYVLATTETKRQVPNLAWGLQGDFLGHYTPKLLFIGYVGVSQVGNFNSILLDFEPILLLLKARL